MGTTLPWEKEPADIRPNTSRIVPSQWGACGVFYPECACNRGIRILYPRDVTIRLVKLLPVLGAWSRDKLRAGSGCIHHVAARIFS